MTGPIAIVTDPERRKYFEAILGTVPVTSYLPTTVNVPEKGVSKAYKLDLKRVTPMQRQAIIDHITKRFKLDAKLVTEDLEKMGVPILADQCTVAIPANLVMPDDLGDEDDDPDHDDWDEDEDDYDDDF